MKLRTISDIDINLNEYQFNYQNDLTSKLDKYSGDFDESIINEIVLWKVNRYSLINNETMRLLNSINKTDKKLNIVQTQNILSGLLETKGIRLPMASTILRFKNPNIYQIIDQRVYRLINKGEELKMPHNIDDQIKFYLNYLKKLRQVCKIKNIPFPESDRFLYMEDKKLNKGKKLKNYG